MGRHIVWTEERLTRAAMLWSEGMTAARIAETLGVTLGSFLGTSSLKRELFPVRMKPKGEAEVEAEEVPEEVPEPVIVAEATTEEPRPAVRHTYIDGRWIEHVKRTTQSGAVVTMPRVSFIDGVREGAD